MFTSVQKSLSNVSKSLVPNYNRFMGMLSAMVNNGEIKVKSGSEYMVNVFKPSVFKKVPNDELVEIINSFAANPVFKDLYYTMCKSPNSVCDMSREQLLHVLNVFQTHNNKEYTDCLIRYMIAE